MEIYLWTDISPFYIFRLNLNYIFKSELLILNKTKRKNKFYEKNI